MLFFIAADLTLLAASYYWVQIHLTKNHLLANKATRWLAIGFLITVLNFLVQDEKEALIPYLFFISLSLAASFALSFFAEENHFQKKPVVFAVIFLFLATFFSSFSMMS